jgi:excisionase family DNA binding protein
MADRMTVTEVSKLLELSPTTVRRLADSGQLGVLQLTPGGHRRFNRRDVEAYTRRTAAEAPALSIKFGGSSHD